MCAWQGVWSKAKSEPSQSPSLVLYWLPNYVLLGLLCVQKKERETKREKDERFLCDAERMSLESQIQLNLLQ